MQFPYRIIDSRISNRKEFDMTVGNQPTHALFYLKKGRFFIETEEKKREEIREGDCLILPSYVHFKRSVIEPIEFLFIKFTNNESCPYTFALPYGRIALADGEAEKRFYDNIGKIEESLMHDNLMSACYREHLFFDLLLAIADNPYGEALASEQYLPRDPLLLSAIDYIRANLGQKIRIGDICKGIGTNASTLHFHFRRELGVSVNQFVILEKMKKARAMLIGTTYSISDIAVRCGFDNVYYFSNSFKKAYGISPLRYREGLFDAAAT